jgi:hypothetical protein
MGIAHLEHTGQQTGTREGLVFDLESLFHTAPAQVEGYTAAELQAHFGRSERWLRPRLHRLIAEGKCEAVQVPQRDIMGRMNWTVRYRFKGVE